MPVDHYENFPVASFLLPPHLRAPIEVIYAFARSADDFADEGDASVAERIAALDDYSAGLDRIEFKQAPTTPLFARLDETIRTHQLPISLFRDLLDAFKQDVTQTRYENFAALMDYCRRSADPIGRLLLHLDNQVNSTNLVWSDAICSALQLINHWQDVAIDWRKNGSGRVYLPQDDLARYGVTEADIANGQCRPAWRELMQFQCQRARALLLSGCPLTSALRGRLGLELRCIVRGGARILDKIDAVRGDVFLHRPKLGKSDWLVIAATVLVPLQKPST